MKNLSVMAALVLSASVLSGCKPDVTYRAVSSFECTSQGVHSELKIDNMSNGILMRGGDVPFIGYNLVVKEGERDTGTFSLSDDINGSFIRDNQNRMLYVNIKVRNYSVDWVCK